MAKNERTSKSVANKASKVLSDPKSSKTMKSIAASALTQAPIARSADNDWFRPSNLRDEALDQQ